jgi:cytochrome c2
VRTDYIRLGLTAALAVLLGIAAFRPEHQTSRVEEEASPGRLLFVGTGCGGCHRIGDNDPAIEIGPSLVDIAERAGDRVPGLSAAEYVTQSIREPQAFTVTGYEVDVMPTFALSENEVAALVDYLLAG